MATGRSSRKFLPSPLPRNGEIMVVRSASRRCENCLTVGRCWRRRPSRKFQSCLAMAPDSSREEREGLLSLREWCAKVAVGQTYHARDLHHLVAIYHGHKDHETFLPIFAVNISALQDESIYRRFLYRLIYGLTKEVSVKKYHHVLITTDRTSCPTH